MQKVVDGLYIGGLMALRGIEALDEAGITHVLSILDISSDSILAEDQRKRLIIAAEDAANFNLIEHFQRCNNYIQHVLDSNGSVLIHCAAGVSRSATVVAAYLMQRNSISSEQALDIIRRVRPQIHPNEGFIKQLEIYEKCHYCVDMENPIYRQWKFRNDAFQSSPPTISAYADTTTSNEGGCELKCKKCRQRLAFGCHIIPHKSKTPPLPNVSKQSVLPFGCAHYFLEPLKWMQPELEKGQLDGRLNCPKCNSKIGHYAWQGMKCSCSEWVTPAISLQRAKVDEVVKT